MVLAKKNAVRKLKKERRLHRSHRPQIKLLYNHYVGPGDGWTFLGSSDSSDDSLDVPLPSPSSIPIHHLQVPPSYDVLGSQDPFDFLDPEASVAADECSSSCVSLLLMLMIPLFLQFNMQTQIQSSSIQQQQLPLLLPLHFQES
mgnify:CR=1 FL=1